MESLTEVGELKRLHDVTVINKVSTKHNNQQMHILDQKPSKCMHADHMLLLGVPAELAARKS